MFDIGWSEMAVVALLALLVIGPKDLPKVMRTAAHWMRKARSVTREFQSGLDDMIREAELEDAKKSIQAVRSGELKKTITDTIDPTGSIGDSMSQVERDARSNVDTATATPSIGTEADPADLADQGAKVTEQPANIAPPHSVVPPEDPFRKTVESTETPPPADAVTTTDGDAAAPREAAATAAEPTPDATAETQKESAKA